MISVGNWFLGEDLQKTEMITGVQEEADGGWNRVTEADRVEMNQSNTALLMAYMWKLDNRRTQG